MPGKSTLSEGLVWENTRRGIAGDEVESLTLQTNRGDVTCCYHPALGHTNILGGTIWVGGAGGGLDGPARGLYPEACRRLQKKGVAGLRLHYRFPNDLAECVLDTLLGVEFFKQEKVGRITLVGHSFGGAVVITAGALSDAVKAVIAMSTQTYGTDLAPRISPRPLLLIHGTVDEVLPDLCSRRVFAEAKPPKELKLYDGAHHGLDEVREELLDFLVDWIPGHLQP
ncbi:MAG: phospholipase [Pedosphaera sp.]|nr:phospholipase [Pedosphaera sp.]